MASIEITRNTVLKPEPKMSNQIPPADLVNVNAGSELPILAYAIDPNNIDFKITLDPDQINLKDLHPSGKNTWYVWREAIVDPSGYSRTNRPTDKPSEPSNTGFSFTLPGHSTIFSSNLTIAGAPHFTWGEALHFDNRGNYRKPTSPRVVDNILTIARVMEEVRSFLGKSLVINSWYRDPATNAAVGGASQSRHLQGDAVDFNVPGNDLRLIYNKLDPWWGSRGGLARGMNFIHIDGRGYRARWNYPGVR